MTVSSLRVAALVLVLAAAVPGAHGSAEARAGGGASFGSRGARSFSMPSPTATAPRAAPFTRLTTAAPSQPGRFGFGTGLLAGLLGASLFGGLGGAGGLFSLLFNLALVGGAIWLVLRLVRGWRPSFAGASAGGFAGATAVPAREVPRPLPPESLGADDYAAFETSLRSVQEAFSREDVGALQRLATPDVARELERELLTNRQRGVRNDVTDTRLLAGDLSETWAEGATTFATVAMRFGAVDVMKDRSTGQVVSGDPSGPTVATELWTFVRAGASPWRLSAIQQAV